MTSLDAVLDQAIALSGSSGGVAGVWAPWAGSWSAASGVVDFGENARPVSTTTRFRLGTLTAELTCTVLLRLVEAGTVSLDDPVTDYVERVAGLEGITLEQLCRHTSGLADYYPGLEPHFISNPERVWSPNELLATGLANNRTGAPGHKWSYSRTGILLLGLALEEATGRTWNDLVKQYVADPLGLDDTALPAPTTTRIDGVLGAYAATIAADGKPVCDAVLDDSAQSSSTGGVAAGAVSSLDDLYRLSEAFATGSLLGEHHARAAVDDDAPRRVGASVADVRHRRRRVRAAPRRVQRVARRADRGVHRSRDRAHRRGGAQQLHFRRRLRARGRVRARVARLEGCAGRRSRSNRSSSCRGRSSRRPRR